MKRGEIYFAELDPTRGSEVQKTRPVIIVSNDASNRVAPMLTVVPMTSNITRIFSFEVLLTAQETGLKRDGKAMTQQIRALDKERILGRCQGVVSVQKMLLLESALKRHLAFLK
jgi:mRNA interferase MazF